MFKRGDVVYLVSHGLHIVASDKFQFTFIPDFCGADAYKIPSNPDDWGQPHDDVYIVYSLDTGEHTLCIEGNLRPFEIEVTNGCIAYDAYTVLGTRAKTLKDLADRCYANRKKE